jgi:phospholipid transport system substrate-binding protein
MRQVSSAYFAILLRSAAGVAAISALTLAPTAVCAQTTAPSAQSFIGDNVQKGLTILNNTALSPADRRDQFETLLLSITDLDRAAVFTLGSYRKGASDADVSAFTMEFQNYAVAVYQSYFARYQGQTLKVTGSVQHAPGDVVVSTLLINPNANGAEPLAIDFRVIDSQGKPMIVDFSVGGVWLAQEERDQFTAFLGQNGGSISALTAHLKQIEANYK